MKRKYFFSLRFFGKSYPLTRHIKNKVISFAPSNKSVMANKLLSTNLEPKWQYSHPRNFTKNDHR